jgi:hypothetical protein
MLSSRDAQIIKLWVENQPSSHTRLCYRQTFRQWELLLLQYIAMEGAGYHARGGGLYAGGARREGPYSVHSQHLRALPQRPEACTTQP